MFTIKCRHLVVLNYKNYFWPSHSKMMDIWILTDTPSTQHPKCSLSPTSNNLHGLKFSYHSSVQGKMTRLKWNHINVLLSFPPPLQPIYIYFTQVMYRTFVCSMFRHFDVSLLFLKIHWEILYYFLSQLPKVKFTELHPLVSSKQNTGVTCAFKPSTIFDTILFTASEKVTYALDPMMHL